MKVNVMKTIKDFPNYQISSTGQVLSLCTPTGKGGRFLKLCKIKSGYYKVSLQKGSKVYQRYVHDLVTINFIGEKGKLVVNHKDGNKLNNNLENLELVTASRNVKHAYDNGLISKEFSGNQYVDRFKNKRRNMKSLILIAVTNLLTSCSSSVFVTDCEHVKSNVWECKK